jgi:hypothetical protein
MSKIPFLFETPVPKYFRENGWFDNENTFKFVTWAFSKCSPHPHKIVIQRKEIVLAPFEFMAGRLTSSAECFLTQKQFRGQLFCMIKEGILKKTANSRANQYSCYVWMVERFTTKDEEDKGQQKGRRGANEGPTKGHNQDDKKTRYKEDHHPYPSLDSGLTDDFSSKEEEEIEKPKVEICVGVFLSEEDLASCIKIKGDIEKVKIAIEFIQRSSKRKSEITDWPNALARWKIPNKVQVRIEDGLAYAENLCKEFPEFRHGDGWRCRVSTNKKTDQRGVLFESESPYLEAFFVALIDPAFESVCEYFIETKNMRKHEPQLR